VKSFLISLKHLEISQQVVGQENWLGLLQMSIAGHDDVFVRLSQLHQRSLQSFYLIDSFRDFLLDEEAQVQSYLVIPGTGGMELASHIAYLFKQPRLDIHMYILKLSLELKLSSFDFLSNRIEPFDYRFRLALGYYPLLCQHPGVGDASLDVLSV
jgi:hypothetical protein